MTNRRQLLGHAAVLTGAALMPAAGFARTRSAADAATSRASDPGEAAKLNALMDEIMQRNLRRQPETATQLGLDRGELAWTKATLTDNSLVALAQDKALNADDLKRLNQLRRAALAGMDAVNFDTVQFSLAVQDDANRRFDYGGSGAGAPYMVSQLTGAYQSAPDFLDTQHAIETREDADAYLARLEALGRQMDQELEVMRHDGALGVIPPDFIIDRTLAEMRAFRDTPTGSATLVASLARRVKEKRSSGDYAGQAARLHDGTVRPAIQRQIGQMESWRPAAAHDAGVWRLKDGDAYYAVSLKQSTTSSISPDQVHQSGLDLVASLTAQTDALMRAQGLTQGSVGARFRAMFGDPKYRYPNTDAGKEKLLADLNARVKEVQARLPQYFGALPKAGVEIHRIPPATEASQPGGYYTGAPIDGSRPGIYWINLRDTAEVPSWTLPTLTYHESIPGHHLQGSLANEADLPLLRKSIGNSGYLEGWALYAEQLAVEMGLYDNDPLGHIGQLHDAMLRAVRLVLDSGMHAKHWSREQAVTYYTDHLGDPDSAAVTEVERYVVWPGQACSYMVGKLTWLRAREAARKTMGRRFDIRRFHDVGLLAGVMPLDVLERRVADYAAGRLS